MNGEIIYDLPEDEYHAASGVGEGQYLTRSMVADYVTCPNHYYRKHHLREDRLQVKGSDAMAFGTYYERMLLDNDVSMYTEMPKFCVSAKGKVVAWNLKQSQYVIGEGGEATSVTTVEYAAQAGDVVTRETVDLAKYLASRFNDTAMGAIWLSQKDSKQSKKQVTVRWENEYGQKCQVRFDEVVEGSYFCDLKTTSKNIDGMALSADAYGYHIQGTMYPDAWEHVTGQKMPFVFAVSETTGMYRSLMRQLTQEQKDYGRRHYTAAMKGIAEKNFQMREFHSKVVLDMPLVGGLYHKYYINDETNNIAKGGA